MFTQREFNEGGRVGKDWTTEKKFVNAGNPSHISMKRSHYIDWDSGTANKSQVLEKFLHARIGQRWNNVYSEICERIDKRTHQGHTVMEWLSWNVEIKPQFDESGQPFSNTRWIGMSAVHGFYVDQEGFLRYARWATPKPCEKVSNFVKVHGAVFGYLPNRRGEKNWYHIKTKQFEDGSKFANDRVLQEPALTRSEALEIYGKEVYGIRKTQISSKTIEELGLTKISEALESQAKT